EPVPFNAANLAVQRKLVPVPTPAQVEAQCRQPLLLRDSEAERLPGYGEAAVWCRNCAANVNCKTCRAADVVIAGEPRRRGEREVSSCEVSQQRGAAPRGITGDLPRADAQVEAGQHEVIATFCQA